MKLMIKVLLGVAVIAVPIAAALQVNGLPARAAEPRIHGAGSVRLKDDARMASDNEAGGLLTELAQASRPPAEPPMRMAQIFPPGPPPHGPGPAGPFVAPPPQFMGPPMPPPTSRAACENRVNGEAALAGYLSSKLRLTADQLQLWQKIEDAAQPALAKLHAACDRLSPEPAPDLPDMVDLLAAETSARLDLIRATREPLRALYQTLTPEQRAALRPQMPPLRRP